MQLNERYKGYKKYKAFVLGLSVMCLNAHATSTQLITPIVGQNLQGVQQVELNLSGIAAYSVQPKHIYVVDISQQVMPMRIEQPMQAAKQVTLPLQIYRWPEQKVFNNPDSINQLQLQLKQGEHQAVVTWPTQSTIALNQQGTDQTWLLTTPDLTNYKPNDIEAQALVLSWAGQDFSSQVQVEGSNNLVDWQFAGLGQVLQTQDANGKPLLQQQVKINQPYAFWRIQFNQPIALQQASLTLRQNPTALWQQQQFKFRKVSNQSNTQTNQSNANQPQWQLSLPVAVAIQKLQFDIPPEQLWRVQVHAKLRQEGREVWQQVAQSELYAASKSSNSLSSPLSHANSSSNEITFDRPIGSRDWRLSIDAPKSVGEQSHLAVQVFAPKTMLYFLAQGVPPYRLIVDQEGLRSAPNLPENLSIKGTATLGETVAHTVPTSVRQYGLWAGLLILMGILAFAAWRLYRSMQEMPQD